MNPKFKINLIGLTVALGLVLAGYGLGDPPRLASTGGAPTLQADGLELDPMVSSHSSSRGALMRHLAMPYVSFAALTPRQES